MSDHFLDYAKQNGRNSIQLCLRWPNNFYTDGQRGGTPTEMGPRYRGAVNLRFHHLAWLILKS